MSNPASMPPDPTTGNTARLPEHAATLKGGPDVAPAAGGGMDRGPDADATRRRNARAARKAFFNAWGLHIVLTAMSFTLIMPFIWMLLTSLKTLDQVGVGGWLPRPQALITTDDLTHPDTIRDAFAPGGTLADAGLTLPEAALEDDTQLAVALNTLIAGEVDGELNNLHETLGGDAAIELPDTAADWVRHVPQAQARAIHHARNAADRAVWVTQSRRDAAQAELAKARGQLQLLEARAQADPDADPQAVRQARETVQAVEARLAEAEQVARGARDTAALPDAELPLDPEDAADVAFVQRVANRYTLDAVLAHTARAAGLDTPPLPEPRRVQWHNYLEVFTAIPFARYYWNSIFVASWVTFLQCFTSSLAAFSFARLQWPGRDKVFVLYLSTMMLPGLVMMIPNYQIMITLGLVDTLTGLILPAAFTAFGTFLLRQFMLTIPSSLDEAAEIDGASKFQVYWDVILPLARPGLVTLSIFTFMGNYNSFFWPLVMQKSQHNYTLPIGLLYFQSSAGEETNLLMAAVTMSVVPMVIVFIVMQKQLVAGIQLGAVKG